LKHVEKKEKSHTLDGHVERTKSPLKGGLESKNSNDLFRESRREKPSLTNKRSVLVVERGSSKKGGGDWRSVTSLGHYITEREGNHMKNAGKKSTQNHLEKLRGPQRLSGGSKCFGESRAVIKTGGRRRKKNSAKIFQASEKPQRRKKTRKNMALSTLNTTLQRREGARKLRGENKTHVRASI